MQDILPHITQSIFYCFIIFVDKINESDVSVSTACCYVTCFFVVFIHQQAAEAKNGELEGRIGSLQVDIDDSRQKQGNMKGELKKFMDILDGKIDELHEFRQGLSKLGVDN